MSMTLASSMAGEAPQATLKPLFSPDSEMAADSSLHFEDGDVVSPGLVAADGAEDGAEDGADGEPPETRKTTKPAAAELLKYHVIEHNKYWKGKQREWAVLSKRKGPLTLLELPIDVLRLIVNEV